MNKDKLNAFLGIVLIVVLFIGSSYIAQHSLNSINLDETNNFIGMIIYTIIVILSIVIAPVSVMPLIPLASKLWGWPLAGLLSIIGWTIGAVIAFLLARKYGVPLVAKFIPMKKIYKLEKMIPENNLFLTIIFFRMVVPVDGLSYFLGLFSKISFKSYTLATIIGITPFAFVFAYAGGLNIYYQLGALAIAFLIFIIAILIRNLQIKRNTIQFK